MDMTDVKDRFMRLVSSTRREGAGERVPEEPPRPDPEAALAKVLAGWVSDDRRKVFVEWIEKEMSKAILKAHQSHLVHAESAYALGFEAGLRRVRDRLNKWASG